MTTAIAIPIFTPEFFNFEPCVRPGKNYENNLESSNNSQF